MRDYSFRRNLQPHQDSRRRHRAQGLRLLIIILLLLLMPGGLRFARAQGDYPGGYTLMPISPDKIALLSMTSDVSFHDDGQTTTVEVQLNYRLHNRDKANKQTLQVAIPGYPAPKPPPTEVHLLVGGKEIKKKPGNQQWWVADVTLKPDQRTNLVMIYSAPLGDGPIVHFRYPLELTAQVWPGQLESARFTISFAEPPNPQSWINLTPEGYDLTAESVTWSYDAADPAAPIDFLFIRPSLWKQIQEARRSAAASNDPEAYKKLGKIYTELAASLGSDQIFHRYYPLAVASYAMAQQLAPSDPASYLELARLYQMRAERSPEESPTYTSLAINELVKALEQGVDDPEIQQRVASGFALLVASARLRGDFDAANTYLQRFQTLTQQYPALANSFDIQAERRALAIDWARHVFEDQGSAPARTVLAQLFGPDIVQPQGVQFARLNSLYVTVRTEPHLRVVDIHAAVRDAGDATVQQLAQSFGHVSGVQVSFLEASPPIVHIEIPFVDADELRQKQASLAVSVPSQPEWGLLRAIFQPQQLVWQKQEERWRTVEEYAEKVSFVAVSADAGSQALVLEQQAESSNPSDPLDALLVDIWRQEAHLWHSLADNSRVQYDLTLYPHPGAPLQKTWIAGAGDELTMRSSVVQYHLLAILLISLAIYAVFVISTGIIFKLSHR